MLDLQLPTRYDWVVQRGDYGKLVVEPLEPGFALTVGIAYRRALLSGIHGAAPVWAKVENVLHEFSHLPGVTEDTLDVIVTRLQVVVALPVNGRNSLGLMAQAPSTIAASVFERDPDWEILPPDAPLATLGREGSLAMEVCVEGGRGYGPAEKHELEALP